MTFQECIILVSFVRSSFKFLNIPHNFHILKLSPIYYVKEIQVISKKVRKKFQTFLLLCFSRQLNGAT